MVPPESDVVLVFGAPDDSLEPDGPEEVEEVVPSVSFGPVPGGAVVSEPLVVPRGGGVSVVEALAFEVAMPPGSPLDVDPSPPP